MSYTTNSQSTMNNYTEVYPDWSNDRSPNSMRGYHPAPQRQSSRLFEGANYGGPPQQGLYTAEDHHAPRYEPASQEYRTPAPTFNGGHFNSNPPYDNQTWSYGGGANTMGGTGRLKPSSRRAAIPPNWVDPMQPTPTYGLGLGESSYAQHQQPQHNQYTRPTPPLDSDELIPTAIVIKNIPFAVKKEQLQDIMQNLHLPLPYAFNYHFDSGVFRGLAFANFTSPEETTKVINAMNQMELAGRKLRVEYKKMLPAAERDRIERDKRERRGQLQEQHQPINGGQLHNQGSMTSLGSNIIPATTPSPISQRNEGKIEKDVDLNEPATLAFYTELTIFKNDNMRETMVFPNSITPDERRVIHTLAHHMGLEHRSEGAGENRQVLILKMRNTPVPQISSGPYYNESRRGLNRAATVDFTENRSLDSNYSDISLRRQGSHLLDIPGSPGGGGLSAAHNLRGAKSFADLRSYSPSPVASTASFPTNLAQNASRYTETYQNTNTSGTPTLTPTSAGGMGGRDELLSSMSSLALGNDRPIGARANYTPSAGPIGSQRPVNGNYDESSRNGASAVPQRQPKGPSGADWNQGFSRSRQNGHMNRGSDSSDRSAPTRSNW